LAYKIKRVAKLPKKEKKKKKDQKKSAIPPRNSNVIVNMLSFPQRGEIVNINLC
jgi:hypothetical protein